MIGFDERDFQVADLEAILLSNNTLVLAEQTTFLEEVVLTAEKKWDTRVSGNSTTSKLLITGFTSNQLGNEIALFVKVKKTPAYIDGIQFFCCRKHLLRSTLSSQRIFKRLPFPR